MRRLFIKFGLAAFGFACLVAWNKYDRSVNYEPVAAEVTRVDEVCYLKKVDRSIGSKTTRTSKEGPCTTITAINQSHPEYQDFELIKVTTVEYRYRSPADGKMHRGKFRKENLPQSGLPLRRGDSIDVMAHKTDPGKTQKY